MNVSTEHLVIASTAFAALVIAWLLLRVIAHLRQSPARYRYFELFTALFVVGFGFLILLTSLRVHWSAWMAVFSGVSIFAGGINLGVVVIERFSRKPIAFSGVTSNQPEGPLFCAFCGNPQAAVPFLIQGPQVCICSGCVAICSDTVKDHGG